MKASHWLVWAATAAVLLAVGCIGVGPSTKRNSPFVKAAVTTSPTIDASAGITTTETITSPDDAAAQVTPTAGAGLTPSPSVSATTISPQVPITAFATPAFPIPATPTPPGGLPPIPGLPPTNTPTPLGARPITPVPIGPEPPKLPGTPVIPTPTFTPVTVVNVPPTVRPANTPVPAPAVVNPAQPPPATVIIPAPTPGPGGQPVAGVTVAARATTQDFTYPAVDIVAVPPTPTPLPTETPIPTPTATWTATWTPQPTNTPRPTYTPSGAGTVTALNTQGPFATQTPYPTVTPVPVSYSTQGTGDQTRGPYFLNQGAVLYIVAIQPQQIMTGTQSSFLTGPFNIILKKQDGSFVNSVGGSVSGTQLFTSTMVTSAPSSDQFRVDIDVPNQETWQLTVRQPP